MRSVDLHVANRAVADSADSAGRGTPAERRPASGGRVCDRRRRLLAVALQADEAHLVAGQHARIGRAVRLVAGRAAFQPHRRVLVGKRTALVAVALEAARLVGRHRLERTVASRLPCGLWQSTQDMAPLGQLVRVRPLERGPLRRVAARALLVDRGGLRGQPARRPAPCGSNGRRRNSPGCARGCSESGRRAWAGSGGTSGRPCRPRPAGSFAGLRMSFLSVDSACLLPGPWQDSQALPCQPRLRVLLDSRVRVLLEGLGDVLVAGLAGVRADGGGGRLRGRLLRAGQATQPARR